jgi:hypothetical protein
MFCLADSGLDDSLRMADAQYPCACQEVIVVKVPQIMPGSRIVEWMIVEDSATTEFLLRLRWYLVPV